jgi:hypothetical protein
MNCTDAFTKKLKKKITKTREARGGGGIYKRRNKRSNRVIIHYNIYKKIIKEDIKILDLYKRGYAVRVKPKEYFKENGEAKDDFEKSLKLGENAFLYFKTRDDWDKYIKYCSKFNEVAELYTKSKEVENNKQWIGEYCTFIKNKDPQEISLICTTGSEKKNPKYKKKLIKLQKKFENIKLPKQAGLGNFDYDYADENEIKNVEYQLSMMIFRSKGIEKELLNRSSKITDKKIKKAKDHINEFCKKNYLDDIKKLAELRALDFKNFEPICPLCLKKIEAEMFFKGSEQEEGREEEDNTQSEIVLMHISGLKPMKLNHRIYNLGWGHKDCNTIQGDKSISETLEYLQNILRTNNMTNY